MTRPPFSYPGNMPDYVQVFAVRLTSQAVYNSLSPFGIQGFFGIPLTIGLSPDDMSAQTGITNILIGSTTTYAQLQNIPNIIVYDGPQPNFTPLPLNQATGILPDGRSWAWLCSVELYLGGVLPTAPVFHVRTGVYTGDGTNSNAIALGLDLTKPNSAVWVGPTNANEGVSLRTDAMSNTWVSGSTTGFANGITLTGTGFTVGNASLVGTPLVNQLGNQYGYVAITNPDGTFIKTGTYTGTGGSDFNSSGTFTNGSGIVVGGVSNTDVGNTLIVRAAGPGGTDIQTAITGWIDASHFTIPVWLNSSNTFSFTVVRGPQTIGNPFGSNTPAGSPTDFWIWGRNAIYTNSSLVVGQSVDLGKEGGGQVVNGAILQLNPTIIVGADANTNGNGVTYSWLALNNTGLFFAANLFANGNFTGQSSPTSPSTPFITGWVAAQRGDAGAIQDACWRVRGGQGTTTSSTFNGNGNNASTGITALVGQSFTVGSAVGPNGVESIWFAWVSTGDSGSCGAGSAIQSGTVHIPYSFTFSGSGGAGGPYSFVLTNGAFPTGLILNENTGLLSGIPTVQGTFSYLIVIRDVHGTQVQSVSCSITIGPTGLSPVLPPVAPVTGTGCSTDLPIVAN